MFYRYRVGHFEFDQAKFELRVNGQRHDAARLPLELLNALLVRDGEVATKEELFEALWPGKHPEDQWLLNAVSKLRGYLGDRSRQHVVTVPRMGYRIDGPIERSAVGSAPTLPPDLEAGRPAPGLPDFKLQSHLGSSTHTEVWLATDDHARIRVFKYARSSDGFFQLRSEYAIASLLRACYPNRDDFLCPLDRNFRDPPFYLLYDYVGPDLAEWLGSEGQTLSREQRLDLYRSIVEIVAAAHSVGVLHRDIKPRNILIRTSGLTPQPVLMDFGSAKALRPELLDKHGITQVNLQGSQFSDGDGVTLMYAAPELLDGGNTTVVTDVYSLGILLYQLVSGDPDRPIDLKWQERLGDPLLARLIQDASAANATERIQSASALLDRLTNLEAERTRQAQQLQIQQAAKLAQAKVAKMRARRPWVLSTLALLSVGLAVTFGLYRHAIHAQQRAERSAVRVTALNEFWQNQIIASGNPFTRGSDQEPSINQVLLTASREIRFGFENEPELAASIHKSLGTAFIGITAHERAVDEFQEAYRLYASTKGDGSPEALLALYNKANALALSSRFEEAAGILDAETPSLQAVIAADHDVALARMIAKFALLERQERLEDAVDVMQRAVHLADSVDVPAQARIRMLLRLANAQQRTADFEAAEQALLQASQLIESSDRVSEALSALTELHYGELLLDTSRYDQAEALLLSAHQRLVHAVGEASRGALQAKLLLSALYQWTDRIDLALQQSHSAFETAQQLFGANHIQTVRIHGQYALNLHYALRTQQAIHELRLVQQAFFELVGPTPYHQMISYYLSEALTVSEEYQQARQTLEQIDTETLQKAQVGMDAELRIEVLNLILDWHETRAANSRAKLREHWAALESCDCGLGEMASKVLMAPETRDSI